MGRLIDANSVYNAIQITTDNFGVAKRVVETNMLTMLSKIPTVEAIPKDQYEARLKADMVAMLTEIQLEIEELDNPLDYDFEGYNQCAVDCEKLILQKIDVLKAGMEDKK
jgi:hypothetical protein